MTDYDEEIDYGVEMVLEVLRRVAHIKNTSEAARRVGVSEGTMRRWRKGKIPDFRGATLPAVERFLGLAGADANRVRKAVVEYRSAATPEGAVPEDGGTEAGRSAEDAESVPPEDPTKDPLDQQRKDGTHDE